jgi:dipeptidyl aminopeptidase/acylaminoacyl peptidase
VLHGWILYPPGQHERERLPAITIIYPGMTYDTQPPTDVSLLYRWYQNPQLFAALGYAVLLPSIPYPGKPMSGNMIAPLAASVLPLVDTAVARGIVDRDRVALLGQSAGGYAVQALITQTDRFRSAISTAGYSDLISLYGTFYGQYRHGDSGDPQLSTALRMMQFERGYYRAGAPPWAAPDRYITNSPIFQVGRVHTPIMLVQGENDFVPVQQSEEYFSALYRQNKRAQFVRYYGEEHTISGRANILDFWRRAEDWLRDTMAPR